MPDYCYSDRLRLEYETHISNPELSGFACYNITFRLSFLPASRDSGRSVIHERWYYSRRILYQFQITGAEAASYL